MKDYFLWLAKFLTVLLVLLFVVPAVLVTGAVVAAGGDGSDVVGKHTVAVVEMKGEVYDTKEIVQELYRQTANPNVEGVVLRIDSPGGAVGPSQDVFHAVKTLKSDKKPIIASMGGVAASGGLYAALGASKVLCQPGTLTGSIGVIMQLPNFGAVTDKVGVSVETIKSGRLKDVGNPFRQMAPEEREYLSGLLGEVHEEFIRAVSEGRGIPVETVRGFADGRVLNGATAVKLGLADGFGDVYDAAKMVFTVKGKPLPEGETPHLYYPTGKFSKVRELLAGATALTDLLAGHRRLKMILQ